MNPPVSPLRKGGERGGAPGTFPPLRAIPSPTAGTISVPTRSSISSDDNVRWQGEPGSHTVLRARSVTPPENP
jgi:hypothetical protein